MKVTIEIPDQLADVVRDWREPYGPPLTVERVLELLADDLLMTRTRPGSWEGSNMQQVVDSHGWEQDIG